MAPQDAQHGGEAQPPPRELGGEEGIEDPVPHLRRHAAAGITHLQGHVAPRGERQGGQQAAVVGLVHRLEAGPDRDEATDLVPDGLGGVGHQIHDELLHLRRIRGNVRQPGREVIPHHRLLGDGHCEELGHLQHQAVQIHIDDLQMALPRIGQQLPGQVRGPQRGLLDLVQIGQGRALRRELHRPQIRVAQDGGEQVVEVVGDAAGQDAETLQLLGLAQGLLRLLPLSDVRPDGHELHGYTALAQEGNDGGVHPVVAPVLCTVLDLTLPDLSGLDRLP